MTDSSKGPPEELPPADWYPDPELPGGQRYWDGSQWTEERRPPGASPAATTAEPGTKSGGLPSFSDWFGATVKVGAQSLVPAALIYIATLVPMTIAVYLVGRWAIADLEYRKTGLDGEFVGVDGGRIAIFCGVVLIALLVWLVVSLLVVRLLQLAHQDRSEPLGASVARAAARAPRFLGVLVLLVAIAIVVVIVFSVLVALVGPAAFLLLLLVIPAGVWLWVKLAFLEAAAVAAPADQPILATSWRLSTGRFWPMFGRLLVLAIALAVASQIFGLITGQIVDDPVAELNLTQEDFDEGFRLGDRIGSPAAVAAAAMLTAGIQSILSVFGASGETRLYLDGDGPTD